MPSAYRGVFDIAKYGDAVNLGFGTAAAVVSIALCTTLKQCIVDSVQEKLAAVSDFLHQKNKKEWEFFKIFLSVELIILVVFWSAFYGFILFLLADQTGLGFLLLTFIMHIIRTLVVLQFCNFNIVLARRFRALNEWLITSFSTDNERSLDAGILQTLKYFQIDNSNNSLPFFGGSNFVTHRHVKEETLKGLGKIDYVGIVMRLTSVRLAHMTLCDICNTMSNSYGVQNLLEVVSCFVGTIIHLYLAFVSVLNIRDVWPGQQKWLVVAMYSTWSLYQGVRIGLVAWSVSAVVGEAARTRRLALKLQLLTRDRGGRAQLQVLATQVYRICPVYTAAGFFTLDLALLYTFCGGVAAYLVILVQFSVSGAYQQVIPTNMTTSVDC
ncbi:putative gustatory receptor 28a [Schistocerca nitens]|uniref:putative gustatory receptor 28a n=1 Tax=Schistocerca nitens TaxID=7011 RepID=UPI002117F501|nr:putative gustatory receptor 28a [Schistocerca nitens]